MKQFLWNFRPNVVCAPCRGVDDMCFITILPIHISLNRRPASDLSNISVSTNPVRIICLYEMIVHEGIPCLLPGWRLNAAIPESLSLFASSMAWRILASFDWE